MIRNKAKFDYISRELFAIMILSDEKQAKKLCNNILDGS